MLFVVAVDVLQLHWSTEGGAQRKPALWRPERRQRGRDFQAIILPQDGQSGQAKEGIHVRQGIPRGGGGNGGGGRGSSSENQRAPLR